MLPIHQHIQSQKQDAVLWQIDRWKAAASDDIFQKAEVTRKAAGFIAIMTDEAIQNAYLDAIQKDKKRFGMSRKEIEAVLGKMPKEPAKGAEGKQTVYREWLDREELEQKGYCTVDLDTMVGYWVAGKEGAILQASNFIIKPIFHVAGKSTDSRHIFVVKNAIKSAVVDVPSTALVSLAELQAELVAEGNFVFFGTKNNLLRIASEMLQDFPLCYEIKQPGYQREGFFVYLNRIVTPGEDEDLKPDDYGIFKKGDQHFLIPAASKVYAGMRSGDDRFAVVKSLTWKQSPVTFTEWAAQMVKVYGPKGQIGISYALLTAMRDMIFAVNGNCPHLYGYGERSSGKSQWAESIRAIFNFERSAFNLNSGTEFAFNAYMSAFRNCPAHMNEFDDKVCSDQRFQAIKSAFDGEGRMRGSMTVRNGVEIQPIDSTLILTGQYISTKDDNSVVSRSIICAFHERQFTDDEKAEFDKLRTWQAQGITSLSADIIRHRPVLEKSYADTYSENLSIWRKGTSGDFNQRIFQNYCHLSTLYFLLQKPLGLPGKWTEYDGYCYNEAKIYSSFIRNSDKLSAFWNTIEALLDARMIEAGWHFTFIERDTIKLRNSDGKEDIKDLGSMRKLLVIRLELVHGLYQKMYRERSGETGMTFENVRHYLSNRDYYIGQVKNQKFRRIIYRDTAVTKQAQPFDNALDVAPRVEIHGGKEAEEKNTTAYVFDYEKLGIALDSQNPDIDGGHET